MNAQKLAVKLFLRDPSQAHGLKLVPVFQSWIQTHALDDHLLIDVADYDHVIDGPGTVLVAHEANLALDSTGGRPGLLYQRKQPLPGPFADRAAAILRYAATAAARLQEQTRLTFRTDEITFRISDRLLAPNTQETFAAVQPDLQRITRDLFGPSAQLTYPGATPTLFEVRIASNGTTTVSDLAARSLA